MKKMQLVAEVTLAMIAMTRASSEGMRLAKPSKNSGSYHVVVDLDFKAKGLVLAPAATSLTWTNEQEPRDGTMFVASIEHPMTKVVSNLIMAPSVSKGQTGNKPSDKLASAKVSQPFCSYFSMLVQTDLIGQENVQLARHKVTVSTSSGSLGDDFKAIVNIPYFTNPRQLKAGTFLVKLNVKEPEEPNPKRQKS